MHAVLDIGILVAALVLSPDPDDNPILATAVEGDADFLVTGDERDLLFLGKAVKIQIVSARQFPGVLDNTSN